MINDHSNLILKNADPPDRNQGKEKPYYDDRIEFFHKHDWQFPFKCCETFVTPAKMTK